MNKNSPSRFSAARRNAESVLGRARKQDTTLKLEQEAAREAITEKTARLRELRLAKEAAEREAAASSAPARRKAPKARRSKQT
ncbi:MAG: hypothetical protein ACREDO_02065 [Methyloceanibacter sp.]